MAHDGSRRELARRASRLGAMLVRASALNSCHRGHLRTPPPPISFSPSLLSSLILVSAAHLCVSIECVRVRHLLAELCGRAVQLTGAARDCPPHSPRASALLTDHIAHTPAPPPAEQKRLISLSLRARHAGGKDVPLGRHWVCPPNHSPPCRAAPVLRKGCQTRSLTLSLLSPCLHPFRRDHYIVHNNGGFLSPDSYRSARHKHADTLAAFQRVNDAPPLSRSCAWCALWLIVAPLLPLLFSPHSLPNSRARHEGGGFVVTGKVDKSLLTEPLASPRQLRSRLTASATASSRPTTTSRDHYSWPIVEPKSLR